MTDTRFEIIPGCTYQLRGHPDQTRVAHIHAIGKCAIDGYDAAFGVICTLTGNGLVFETGDWRIDGMFVPEDECSLDIVSAIGLHAPADGCAMVPLYGGGGFKSRLQEIVDQSRNLRQGGASVEDLSDIEAGLERAVALADDMLSDLIWSPPVTPAVSAGINITWDNPDGPTAA